jgi:hypothetical protein
MKSAQEAYDEQVAAAAKEKADRDALIDSQAKILAERFARDQVEQINTAIEARARQLADNQVKAAIAAAATPANDNAPTPAPTAPTNG